MINDTRKQYAIWIEGERVCSSEMIRHPQRTRVFYMQKESTTTRQLYTHVPEVYKYIYALLT